MVLSVEVSSTGKLCSIVGIFLSLTILSGVCLASNTTSATSSNTSTDNVAITIPIACTLVSSGNNSHSTNIVNGTYATDIGTTTLKVTCNDNQGFAIYAVGYTGDEIGATNSTKLVGTPASSNTTIDTGTATGPVNNNDTSNWAMKLNTTTSPTPTYPITIDNSYNNYNIVPASYTKVAHRDSGTDVGTNAIGSTLTTTYAAYISKLQYPDTYTGQVKYTLVHPSTAPAPRPQVSKTIEVTYDSSVLYFDSESTQKQNVVTYSATCESDIRQFDIYKTSNLNDAGVQNGAYSTQNIIDSRTYSDASKIKVVVDYGFTANTGEIIIAGDNMQRYEIYSETDNISGTQTYTLDGNHAAIYIYTWDTENLVSGYDYGAYITVYPLDENDDEMEFEVFDCEWTAIDGEYLEPRASAQGWLEYWYHTHTDSLFYEQGVLRYLTEHFGDFDNTDSITFYAQIMR